MSSPSPSVAVPVVKSNGVGSDIRIIVSVVYAIFLGIIALIFNSRIIQIPLNIPTWTINLIVIPLFAVVGSFGFNCLIQYLSCGVVTLGSQAERLPMIPIPFYAMALLLYIFPSLKWPIEGMVQQISPDMRHGLSAAFYTFFMGLYTQAYMNGLAQVCPK